MLIRSKILLGKGKNTAAVSVAVLGKCAAANADIFSLYAASSVAVSYTHLDVYKRQVQQLLRTSQAERILLCALRSLYNRRAPLR